MVRLKRLHARCIALITLKPKDLNQTLACIPHGSCTLYSVLCTLKTLHSLKTSKPYLKPHNLTL